MKTTIKVEGLRLGLDICKTCYGSGKDFTGFNACPACYGRGYHVVPVLEGLADEQL